MNGRHLKRLAIGITLSLASLAQAATFSVSNQASCLAVPGAAFNATGSVCTLGANLSLNAGDSLTVNSPVTLQVPAGVTLANAGGLLRVLLGAKVVVNGVVQHAAGTVDTNGVFELRGPTAAIVTSPGTLFDNKNLVQVFEGRFDNGGTLNQSTFVSLFALEPAGVLRNFGAMGVVSGADVFSKGRIENTGSIANNGAFENHCGVFVNSGTYTGLAVITPNCWIGGATGKWNVAANWSAGVVPGASAYAVIPAGTATVDANLTVTGTLLVEGGNLVVAPGVAFTNSAFLSLAAGVPGSSTVRNLGVFTNRATLENSNRFVNEGSFTNTATIRAATSATGTFVNTGTWSNQSLGSVTAQGLENAATGAVTNQGTMTLVVAESFNAGKLTNAAGALLNLDNRLRNRAGASLVNLGRLFVTHRLATPAGLDNEAGAMVENRAGASLSIIAAAAFVNNAGVIRNDGSIANGGIFNNTGAVCGTGTITGNVLVGNLPTVVCRAIANAGADRSVGEGTLVTLDGSSSTSPNGAALSFAWTQTAGPGVALSSPNAAKPTFAAPFVTGPTVLSFSLVVNDGFGASAADFVDVVVTSTNTAPFADAGADRTAKAGTVVTLDGSGSFDPDGNAIVSYQWTQVAGPVVTLIPGPSVAKPSFTAPAAASTLIFKLRVADDKEASAFTVGLDSAPADTVAVTVVENSRPVAVAGPDRLVAENSLVLLDGGASRDSDAGDVLSYAWRQVAGPPVALDNATSAIASFTAPNVTVGADVTLAFELVARDNDAVNPLASAPARVNIGVFNLNDPPRCDLAAPSVGSLWPPDSKMETVSITGVRDDGASGMPLTVRITSVRQDEPVSGLNAGDVGPDAAIVSAGATDSVQLRRERSGKGNGRVYAIAFTANDGLASCSGSVKVEVPHSRDGVAAVDDGAVYDSTH